jgi:aspartate carbamoyltransferase catalytic subunit
LRKNGVKFSFHQSIEEVLGKVDILYMTRIQKERFNSDTIRCQNNLRLSNPSILSKAKKNLKILHPLPRLDEIDTSIDTTPHAYYFEQAENGLYVRQALLSLILKRGK